MQGILLKKGHDKIKLREQINKKSNSTYVHKKCVSYCQEAETHINIILA
jgi:hypothetical protein